MSFEGWGVGRDTSLNNYWEIIIIIIPESFPQILQCDVEHKVTKFEVWHSWTILAGPSSGIETVWAGVMTLTYVGKLAEPH